ncbi:glycosyltransferase family 39 protein [Clostridium isatidis]|uniref:Uncharacterized protein n=1 Tax=Clostridium isatidis TaxID=182773 RepID=A0A343JA91_9CLOT|nr:glycosyltransferase family 39 protein [Clostridium isatidis]ASW42449.1 hypothetical protein BEN51_02820 [Clostridium isatidis]
MNVKERKYIVNLMVFSFSIFMLYAVIIPFNNAPDEQLRFDIVDFILKYKELPIGGDPRLFYGDFGVTYAFKPYIAYVFSALLCILAELLKINIEPFMISRFFSVLCGVGTVYFTYLICKKIFKESKIKYVLPIFFASIPQFSFLNSYVNQDSLMIFLSSITVFLWIEGISNNWEWDIVIKISIVNGIIMLTYMNGYSIILCTVILVILTYKNKNSEFFKKTMFFTLISLLISGWFFVRNLIIYNGELFGDTISLELQEKLAIDSLKPSLRDVPYKHGLNMITMLIKTDWLKKTFMSFWAMLGNMDIRLNSVYYYLFMVISMLTVLVIIAKVKSAIVNRKYNDAFKLRIVFIFEILIVIILSIIYSTYNDFQPQGRYIYPAIIPIIIFIGETFEYIINKFRLKEWIVYLFIGVIIIFNIALPILAMIKKYYFVV